MASLTDKRTGDSGKYGDCGEFGDCGESDKFVDQEFLNFHLVNLQKYVQIKIKSEFCLVRTERLVPFGKGVINNR